MSLFERSSGSQETGERAVASAGLFLCMTSIAGTRSLELHLSLTWVTEIRAVGPSSAAFPSTLAGNGIRDGAAGTGTAAAVWNASIAGSSLVHCATRLYPTALFLKNILGKNLDSYPMA